MNTFYAITEGHNLYKTMTTYVVTKPDGYSVPNLPARPAICFTCEADNVDILFPSNFSRELNTIRRMFLNEVDYD